MIVTNNKIQKLLKQNRTDEIAEFLSHKDAGVRLNAFLALSDICFPHDSKRANCSFATSFEIETS